MGEGKGGFRNKLLFFLCLIVAFGVIGFVVYSQTPEYKAKSVVNNHLNSIKTGKSNPYETVDISKVREIFINVLGYKFLTILKKGKAPHTLSIGREYYKTYDIKQFKTYEEYIEYHKRLYAEEIKNGKAKMVGDTLEVYYEQDYFELLYDVECTNRLGHKLYKKVVFQVEKSSGKYEIVGIKDR